MSLIVQAISSPLESKFDFSIISVCTFANSNNLEKNIEMISKHVIPELLKRHKNALVQKL